MDKELKRSIDLLSKNQYISKIVLGRVEGARHSFPPGHIRYKSTVRGGIKINGYSGNGVMDIFIKIEPIEKIKEIIDLIGERYES